VIEENQKPAGREHADDEFDEESHTRPRAQQLNGGTRARTRTGRGIRESQAPPAISSAAWCVICSVGPSAMTNMPIPTAISAHTIRDCRAAQTPTIANTRRKVPR
jgi:hypothetical protein